MAVRDLTSQRLYLDSALEAGTEIALTREQTNYLINVLRLKDGDTILVFNVRDGEWRGELRSLSKRAASIVPVELVRHQETGPDIHLLFAPLKRARLDYLVQKAAELGVRRLCPVVTQHTVAERVNLDRMRANVIEAAEQCGILYLPDLEAPVKLAKALDDWHGRGPLVFCDEAAAISDPVAALSGLGPGPVGVVVGPEGGFSAAERESLLALPHVRAVSLGPRIMRADTAAVAILSLVNAVAGDWR